MGIRGTSVATRSTEKTEVTNRGGSERRWAARIRRRFRARWEDLCASAEFVGRWVAVDQVKYEAGTREPSEVEVVDIDEDLASLCSRMRAANQTSCCVLHCLPKRRRSS